MQEKEFIELVRILINTYDSKLLKNNIESVNKILKKFDKGIVETLLFVKNKNGEKVIDERTLKFLKDNNFDMKDVCFDNVRVNNHSYLGLKNTVINIDKVVDHDISNTVLKDVKVIGSLDDAIINGTNFEGYIGKLILNPQKVRNKDISITNLSGIIIDGIFDGCDIFGVDFSNASGGIYVNPQKVKNRDLRNIDFCGVNIIGDNGCKPSFKGCKIRQTSFNGAKGVIEINPQELDVDIIMYNNFDGVKFIGGFENLTLFGNEFRGSRDALIDLNTVKNARIITSKTLDNVNYIPLRENSKKRVFSVFKRNKN